MRTALHYTHELMFILLLDFRFDTDGNETINMSEFLVQLRVSHMHNIVQSFKLKKNFSTLFTATDVTESNENYRRSLQKIG